MKCIFSSVLSPPLLILTLAHAMHLCSSSPWLTPCTLAHPHLGSPHAPWLILTLAHPMQLCSSSPWLTPCTLLILTLAHPMHLGSSSPWLTPCTLPVPLHSYNLSNNLPPRATIGSGSFRAWLAKIARTIWFSSSPLENQADDH